MKYIMMETLDGQLIPFLFPDCIVHSEMVKAATYAIHKSTKQYAKPISAGFVGIDGKVSTSGKSESTGLRARKLDAAYIMLGDAASRMPASTVETLANKVMKNG